MNHNRMDGAFPRVLLSGSAGEIGWRHGSLLRDGIHEALDFYRGLFGLPEAQLLALGERYAGIIGAFRPEYAEEIEAIAAGASTDPRLVYVLNSRSEILNNVQVGECTAVFDSARAILAQTWDWAEIMGPLVVDMTIERSGGRRLRMLTEPGIIGKIGMNDAGLGVCLNILGCDEELDGLPVHVLLRAILECGSLDEVGALVREQGTGKASHVLVGDDRGRCLSIEFAGPAWHRLQSESGRWLHTNHYLADPSLDTAGLFPSTHQRLDRGQELLARDASREGIRNLLLDRAEGDMAICRPWAPSDIPGFGRVGTVFSVLMDLRRREMEIRPAVAADASFYRGCI